MAANPSVADALALALKLPPKERLELVKQVVSSVESEIANVPFNDEPQSEEHWGKSLNRLMDEIGPIELVDSHIEDPVEWVKAQRRKRIEHLKQYGGDDWGDISSEDSAE